MVDHVVCGVVGAGESTRPYVFSGNPFSRNPAMHFSPCRFPPMMEIRRSRAEWRATKTLPTGGGSYSGKKKHPPFSDFLGSTGGGYSYIARWGVETIRRDPLWTPPA